MGFNVKLRTENDIKLQWKYELEHQINNAERYTEIPSITIPLFNKMRITIYGVIKGQLVQLLANHEFEADCFLIYHQSNNKHLTKYNNIDLYLS